MNLTSALTYLLDQEIEFEDKLDLLTAISIQTSNDEVFQVCESLRGEIVESYEKKENKREDLLHSPERQRDSRDSGDMGIDKVLSNDEGLSLL